MSAPNRQSLLQMLAWQMDIGAGDAISALPIDRYSAPFETVSAPRQPPKRRVEQPPKDAPAAMVAKELEIVDASAAQSLPELAALMEAFDGMGLKQGAERFVFSDGRSDAKVMIVGEAPGREEDRLGKPFVGQAGRLLDRMFAAIGMARDHPDAARALYITNVLPWRPPGNRTPESAEIALFRPFLLRHIELADPGVVVVMGNPACEALLARRGITKLRGQWHEALGKPVLPMLHPAYLLRNPIAKRQAWWDLQALARHLKEAAHG